MEMRDALGLFNFYFLGYKPRLRSLGSQISWQVNAMDFTTQFVRAKNPCAQGYRWFVRNHLQGGNYQQVLDDLVKAGRVDDACWLLDQFGPTSAVLKAHSIEAEAVVFAGSIEVSGAIDVNSIVRAGRSIMARGGICAGGSIIAGSDIHARANIRSGGKLQSGGDIRCDWGVEAAGAIHCGGGLRVSWGVTSGGRLDAVDNVVVGHDLMIEGPIACGKGLHIRGTIKGFDSIRAGQGILCGASVYCATHLEAGLGIKAAESIVAGGSIRAGESLSSGEDLRAGSGYGIFAGLCVQHEAWDASARVCASVKPERLMSGCWSGVCPV